MSKYYPVPLDGLVIMTWNVLTGFGGAASTEYLNALSVFHGFD